MQLKTRGITVLILGLFWGIIGFSMVTGFWQTKLNEQDVIVKTPADIKGWMTLTEISGTFNISASELVEILGLPSNVETDEPIKEIAERNGKEVDEYREILKERLGTGNNLSETTSKNEKPEIKTSNYR